MALDFGRRTTPGVFFGSILALVFLLLLLTSLETLSWENGSLLLGSSLQRNSPTSRIDKHHDHNNTGLLPPLTVFIQLSGEFGNHLAKLAAGYSVAAWLQEDYHIPVRLVLRHQDHKKWQGVADQLERCLIHFSDANWSEGNNDEVLKTLLLNQQQSSTRLPDGSLLQDRLDGVNSDDPQVVQETLAWIAQAYFNHYNQTTISSSSQESLDPHQNFSNYSDAPMQDLFVVVVNHLSGLDVYTDRYYEALRELFALRPSCCPSDDDHASQASITAVYVRNFVHEMPRKGIVRGYQEATPTQLAQLVWNHLQQQQSPSNNNNTILLLSRYTQGLEPYRLALLDEHAARSNATAPTVAIHHSEDFVHDFCTLQSATHAIGPARSTFYVWARLLPSDTASTTLVYSVDASASRQAVRDGTSGQVYYHYNWTHKDLQQRIQFTRLVIDEDEDEANDEQ